MTTRMTSITKRYAAIALLAMLTASGAALADRHDYRAPPNQHFDGRFSHNHYYYDRGYVVPRPPRAGYPITRGRDRFWYDGGMWYRGDGVRWIVVGAPLGAFVPMFRRSTRRRISAVARTTTPTTRTTPRTTVAAGIRWWMHRSEFNRAAVANRRPTTRSSFIRRTGSHPTRWRAIAMNAIAPQSTRLATTPRNRAAVCRQTSRQPSALTTNAHKPPASTRAATA